jgi:hypothetical protein
MNKLVFAAALSFLAATLFAQQPNGAPALHVFGGWAYDYGFAEWRFSDALRLHAGRMKHPFGIYSEIFDVGTLRPFYTLSQSVYGAQVDYAKDRLSLRGEWVMSRNGPAGEHGAYGDAACRHRRARSPHPSSAVRRAVQLLRRRYGESDPFFGCSSRPGALRDRGGAWRVVVRRHRQCRESRGADARRSRRHLHEADHPLEG